MSDWRQVEGADRGEALDAAVRTLGVAPDDMEIEDVEGDAEGVVTLRVRVAGNSADTAEVVDTAIRTVASDETPSATDIEAEADDEYATDDEGEDEDPEDAARAIEEQKDVALDFLVDLLEAFDLEGEIAAEYRDGIVFVDVNGDELGALIGRRGATLAALGEIAKTVVQRRTASRVRLNVDVQGYRARRREALEKYRGRLARDVAETGVEKALEPMPASERKVVHDAVAGIDGVRSFSEGVEPKRNVVISPV